MTPINFKLINLLNSLSHNEIKEFKKFISSPVYFGGRNYIPVLEHLLKNKTKGFENIYARDIYEKLYPGKKFSRQTLKNRFSELYKLGEEFLVYLNLKYNKPEKEKIILSMLIDRKIHGPFESKYKKLRNQLLSEKYNDKKLFDFSYINELHLEYLNSKKNIGNILDHYYEKSQLNFCMYLINMFQAGFEFSLQEYDNKTYDSNFVYLYLKDLDLDEQMKAMNKSNYLVYRITAMYYYLFKAFVNPENEEFYFLSHKIFTQLSAELDDKYKINIFNLLTYFCMRKQNEGNKKFRVELFELYKEKLSQGLFSDLQNPIYLFNNFRDYVFIGLALKKYKWVEDFIYNYSRELPADIREDEMKLSYAKLYIAHSQYEKSLINLENIKTTNYLLYLDSSTLKLCSYYQLERYEDAFLELDKLKHYIRNHNEIPLVHKQPTMNFLKIYQKLLNIILQPEKNDIGYLEKEIHTFNQLSKKDWILEKISELKD
ncbi:MAG TPA: hypothetical protein PKC91_06900 [Ignavibacteria bacterium]|mgnify:CR=1 FL=1|nr:hypothetical protein [Ignavibacteria bacterium]